MMGWMAPLRHLGAKVLVGEKPPADREPSMNEITTVGLDLAKNVFQVHGVDAEGQSPLLRSCNLFMPTISEETTRPAK